MKTKKKHTLKYKSKIKSRLPQKKNRIAIVLDSSGSMAPMRDEVVRTFNSQIEAIRANNVDMDTKVSLYTFSTLVNTPRYLNQDISTIVPITASDYITNGWTALYDAMGRAISDFNTLPEANDPNTSFLLFVVTDGHENQSRTWNFTTLSSNIRSLEATGRATITYLGAAEGLRDVGISLGMSVGNTISGQSLRNTGALVGTTSTATANYMSNRASGQLATTNFYNPNLTPSLNEETGNIQQTLKVFKHEGKK